MADIELVIKIPEGLKKDFELEQWTALSCMEMKDVLINGTPLPKNHGRLIDGWKAEQRVSEVLSKTGYQSDAIYALKKLVPTIIEAERS